MSEDKIKLLEMQIAVLRTQLEQKESERRHAVATINLYRLTLKWVGQHIETLPGIVESSIRSDLCSYLNMPLVDEIKELIFKRGEKSSFE